MRSIELLPKVTMYLRRGPIAKILCPNTKATIRANVDVGSK